MADPPHTIAPLEIVASETTGYCDPESGMCVWPGAATPTRTSHERPPDESEPDSSDE